jgi:hypothetical protein
VTLRLGDLEDEVAARSDVGVAPGAIVRRDLARYYQLLKHTPMPFKTVEALVVAWLVHENFDPTGSGYRYIWAHVEEELARFDRLGEAVPEPYRRILAHVKREDLVSKLRNLQPHQTMRIVDAVERFWLLHRGGMADLVLKAEPDWPVADKVLDDLCTAGLLDSFEAFCYRFLRDWARKGSGQVSISSFEQMAASRPEGQASDRSGDGTSSSEDSET